MSFPLFSLSSTHPHIHTFFRFRGSKQVIYIKKNSPIQIMSLPSVFSLSLSLSLSHTHMYIIKNILNSLR